MRLLYAGFDAFDVAFQGALPRETVEMLEAAKEEAAARQEPVLREIGPGQVPAHVEASGLRGGYAFRLSTGPLGEVLAFKANSDPRQWNLFASIRASALAAYGMETARQNLLDRLQAMGCTVTGHAVNRVDYALDFWMQGFELSHERFICHPRTKVALHHGAKESDRDRPSMVARGRKLESITIGKMPGRQVIVYDKRRAAIEQRKLFWFEVWGLDREDRSGDVWRVELRAGKKELKDKWGLRSFEDIDSHIGDVLRHALDEVRCVLPSPTDSNISRAELDPLWQATIDHVEGPLGHLRNGLLPGGVLEVERAQAAAMYRALVLGNLAGWVAASSPLEGIFGEEAIRLASRLVEEALEASPEGFDRRIQAARDRLRFFRE